MEASLTLMQKTNLWLVTQTAKSAYRTWYSYSYGIGGGDYDHRVDGQLSGKARRAEEAMNEYRRELGLVPLWPYMGHWTPADGKSTVAGSNSQTPEQYWAGVTSVKRLFG